VPSDNPRYPGNGEAAGISGTKATPVRLAYRSRGVKVTASVADHGEMRRLGLPTLVQTFLTSLTWMCSINGAPTEGWLVLTLADRQSLWRVTRNEGDSSSLRLIPVSGEKPAVLRGATGCFSR
jgi:hypothetical protein